MNVEKLSHRVAPWVLPVLLLAAVVYLVLAKPF